MEPPQTPNPRSITIGTSATTYVANLVVPGITLSATPASQAVPAGASNPASYSITASPFGGFSGSLSLTLSGVTAGVSPSWSSLTGVNLNQIPPLSITVGAAAPPGVYVLTLAAGASGIQTQTAQITLVIQPAPFTVSVTPNPLYVQGSANGTQQANFVISATGATGFSSPITLNWPLTSPCAGWMSYISPLNPITPGQQEMLTLEPYPTNSQVFCNYQTNATGGGASYPVFFELVINPTATFSTQLAQPSQTVTPPASGNATASYTVNATSLNNFAGTVNFTASAPNVSGISLYPVSPIALPAGGNGTTSVTALVAAGTPAGSYPITITATGSSGTQTHTATLNVQQGPTFSLSAGSPQTTQQGRAANFTISLSPAAGFNGAVNLNVGPITGGVAASLSSGSVSAGSSATLTLTAANNAALGAYSILVNGTSAGAVTSHTPSQITNNINFAPPLAFRMYQRFQASYEVSGNGILPQTAHYIYGYATEGDTPEPCTGLQLFSLSVERNTADGQRALTSDGSVTYQINDARLGSEGQALNQFLNGDVSANYTTALPWIWSVIQFDVTGKARPWQQGGNTSNLQIFPTYQIYVNSTGTLSAVQGALDSFIGLNSTSQFSGIR